MPSNNAREQARTRKQVFDECARQFLTLVAPPVYHEIFSAPPLQLDALMPKIVLPTSRAFYSALNDVKNVFSAANHEFLSPDVCVRACVWRAF